MAFLGFGLGQVGNVENRSLYALSPSSGRRFVAGFVARLSARADPARLARPWRSRCSRPRDC